MADEPTIEEAKALLEAKAEFVENARGAPHGSVMVAAAIRTLLASHASLEERGKGMEAALRLMVETFGRQAGPPIPVAPDDDEAYRVMRLGDQIGYGNLMDLASRGWRHRLAEDGNPVGGEFAVGTCVSLAQRAMSSANAALAAFVNEKET